MDREALFRMLYLRREYTALLDNIEELQGLIFLPTSSTVCSDDTWQGIIFIRADRSPWYKGAFSFHVTFPPKYPFECPKAEFDLPLLSHPMLIDGKKIPFEAEYTSSDPMKVSIMMRLLKFMRRLFVPQEWKRTVRDERTGQAIEVADGAAVDTRFSQQDVELRSVAQEVILSKPYVEYLTIDAKEWLLRTYSERACGETTGTTDSDVAHAFSSWLTRTFLPSVKAL